MENQPNLSESKKENQLCHEFQKIGEYKTIISEQLENLDWETELHFECNNINLSSELTVNKAVKTDKISNGRKKTLNKPWTTKRIIKSKE